MMGTLIALAMGSATDSSSGCINSFAAVHEIHVTAILERDLDAYRATLGNYDGKMMILPDGNVWDTTAEVVEGHVQWFADSSWTFDHRLVHTLASDSFGLAVHEVRVNRPEQPGEPFLLSMLFAPDTTGCWTLIHDQNTPLAEQ